MGPIADKSSKVVRINTSEEYLDLFKHDSLVEKKGKTITSAASHGDVSLEM